MSLRALLQAHDELVAAVDQLSFSAPVTHTYNPLHYASSVAKNYLKRYGKGRKRVSMLGMNPGPFGMAQTGVPFGEVAAARNWLGINAPIGKPTREHPKRPITGFGCTRSEVSGRRLWGWCEKNFQTAERFFQRFYVHNFCPLVFMDEGGRNLTPDKLPASERGPLFEACEDALRKVVELQRPRMVIGVGAFAEKRAQSTLSGFDLEFGRIPHPSPGSPLANGGWEAAADAAFAAMGLPDERGW